MGIIQDFYLATQLNAGYGYTAYLGGLGVDIEIPYFVFLNLNAYYKSDNFDYRSYQITTAYKSEDFMHLHFEGFVDITSRDFNTQNQLLYNVSSHFSTKEQLFIGSEWVYYDYNYKGNNSNTNTFQVMIKCQF